MGTVEHLARGIEQDLARMFSAMFKSSREKLAIMIAALIEARSCNTMELAARLPIERERAASRYAWVERFLATDIYWTTAPFHGARDNLEVTKWGTSITMLTSFLSTICRLSLWSLVPFQVYFYA